ncbi:MAG TPA: efflux transporter periplasmic adaptor subunit, partial [Pseudomonas sp.]|nr:efflux transporter periplasmic adaptor subunit [Pseudomonas sp.]
LVDTSAVLTKVVSDDRIYATFDGDEDTYLRVGKAHHNGKDVNVKVGLANEQGFPHEGKLEFVDNQLDPQTGGVRMRAIFVNADKSLAPGLFARVQLQGGTEGGNQSQTVLINERAISTDQDRKFVFVVNGLPRVMPGATLAPHMVSMDFDPDAPVVQATSDAKPDAKAKG